MPDTKIIVTWENEHQTIMRIHYPANFKITDYMEMMVEVCDMIEGNPATIVYINHYPEGSRMPDGNMIAAATRMTKTFTVEAMIQWHETETFETMAKVLAKSFGFQEGKNIWFVRDEETALTLADDVDAKLNPIEDIAVAEERANSIESPEK